MIDKAKACLLHFLGVGIAGAESGAALVPRRTVEREEAQASASARIMLSGTGVERMERHPHHPRCVALAQRVRVIGSELIPPLSPRLTVQRRHGLTVVGTMSDAEAFRFGFEEDAQVIRGLVPEMALPAAQVERLVASVRQLEQLSDIDQLLALTIAPEKVAL